MDLFTGCADQLSLEYMLVKRTLRKKKRDDCFKKKPTLLGGDGYAPPSEKLTGLGGLRGNLLTYAIKGEKMDGLYPL